MSPIGKILVNMMETEKLISAIEEEQRMIKTTSAEDCMKLAKMLCGFEIEEFKNVMELLPQWFDYFYDMEIEQMHAEIERMSAIASEHVQKLHNLGYIGKYD